MKFSAILFGAALCLFSSVEANINTNTPFNGVTWNGGEQEEVKWNDDGKTPKLGDIGITSVDLMAGGPDNQVLVKNIGKVPATDGTIGFNVPKDLGPPGNFYFIKFTDTTGKITSFSGSFSIAKVNGKIQGFDPKNPDIPQPKTGTDPTAPTAPTAPTPPTTPTTPTTPTIPSIGANDPAKIPKAVANTAATNTASVPAAPVASTPSTISSNGAANLFPSFAGVATAAVAFAFTYL